MAFTSIPLVATAFLYIAVIPSTAVLASDIARVGDHVRTNDEHVRAVLEEGIRRSESLRRLVTRLDASDVTVFVKCDCTLPDWVSGRLTFLSATSLQRYVLVRLSCRISRLHQIGSLGHELQHAVEVADTTSIVNERSMARAYREVGFQTGVIGGATAFETVAARATSERILREISGNVRSQRVGATARRDEVNRSAD